MGFTNYRLAWADSAWITFQGLTLAHLRFILWWMTSFWVDVELHFHVLLSAHLGELSVMQFSVSGWDLTPRWLACCCIFVFTLKILFWLSAEKKRISSIKTWKLTAASRGRSRAGAAHRSGGGDKSVFLHDAWLSARCLIRVKSRFLINDIQTVLCKVLWGLSTFWSVASNWSVTAESAQLWPINISLGQKNHLISSRASPQLGASLYTVDI